VSRLSNPISTQGKWIAGLCLLLLTFLTVQEGWHRHFASSSTVRQAELCLTCSVSHTADTSRVAEPVPLARAEFIPYALGEPAPPSLLGVFALYVRPPPVQ
jgi:hypothetical protein